MWNEINIIVLVARVVSTRVPHSLSCMRLLTTTGPIRFQKVRDRSSNHFPWYMKVIFLISKSWRRKEVGRSLGMILRCK